MNDEQEGVKNLKTSNYPLEGLKAELINYFSNGFICYPTCREPIKIKCFTFYLVNLIFYIKEKKPANFIFLVVRITQ